MSAVSSVRHRAPPLAQFLDRLLGKPLLVGCVGVALPFGEHLVAGDAHDNCVASPGAPSLRGRRGRTLALENSTLNIFRSQSPLMLWTAPALRH